MFVPIAIPILPITSYLIARDAIPMLTGVKIILMLSVTSVTQEVQPDDKLLR